MIAAADRLDSVTSGTQSETEYWLISDAHAITHLVCCRDVPWQTTFCGISGPDSLNPAAEVLCTMCLEEIETMSPGCVSAPEKTCPVDNRRCPDEHEVALRMARETGPTS